MWVKPFQLVPGCIIKRDVMGKSIHPIVTKQTIIEEEHITILHKFLIEKVEVLPTLSTGIPFNPKQYDEKTEKKKVITQEKQPIKFSDLYQQAIDEYKEIFAQIQAGNRLDIHKVRQVMIPLLEKVDDIGFELYLIGRISSKEDYYYHHCISTGLISAFLAKKLGFHKEWIQIGLAGLLADSGMSKLNNRLFKKEQALTKTEYEEIKQHPTYSYRLVKNISSLSNEVKIAILQHHERIDGSGYPIGVDESKLHIYARIIAVADTYHAMTSNRVYQQRKSPFKVIEEMMVGQFGKFDPHVLEVFIGALTNFSNGTKVMLSNHRIGEIVYIEKNHPTRPIVKLDDSDELLILTEHKNIFIEDIVNE